MKLDKIIRSIRRTISLTILFLSIFSSDVTMAGYDYKQESLLTHGKGIVYVTVRNMTEKTIYPVVNICLTNHEGMMLDWIEKFGFFIGCGNHGEVPPGQSVAIPLLKPLVGKLLNYLAIPGVIRPSIDNINVCIVVSNTSNSWGGVDDESLTFPARYFEDTLFVDVPSDITIPIS